MNTLLHEPTFRTDHVLIDTWWNVNVDLFQGSIAISKVLIDTWWNVNNMHTKKVRISSFRFNRYMVECE